MKHTYHPIGTWVEFARVARAGVLGPKSNRREVYENTLTTPLAGQVVGVTRLYGGRRCEGSYDDPAYLADTYAIQVYLVRLAMRGEPIRVMPEAITVLSPDGRKLPFQRAWDAPSARGDYKAPVSIIPNPREARKAALSN